MILKIDVNKLMEIIGKQGVSFFGICSERKLKKIEEALIKNIGEWFSSISEEADKKLSLDEFIDKYGYNEAMNIVLIRKMEEHGLINNHPTFSVYDAYLSLCEINDLTPIYNKISFSRDICKYLGYSIQDFHKKQHKYRMFRKLEGGKSTLSKD